MNRFLRSVRFRRTMCKAMGLTACPQYPPWLPMPSVFGEMRNVSWSTPHDRVDRIDQ